MKNNSGISPLKSSWVKEIARIHYSSLPNDFLPSFGVDFLSNIFYPAVLKSSFGKVFVALRNDDEPIGFVLVTTDSSAFLNEIVRNRLCKFLKIGIKSSVRSMENFKNNVEIVLSSIFSKSESNIGEIYIIAVKKPFRGKGIGKLLIKKSIEFIEDQKLDGIKIKTISSNTKWINYFYSEGWKKEREFRLIGKVYISLIHLNENTA